MDRLGASVVERGALQSGRASTSQASQLKALAAVITAAATAPRRRREVRGGRADSAGPRQPSRRPALRRLYAPAHGHAGGRPRVRRRVASLRRGRHDVYSRRAAEWHRSPQALLAVASSPAFGLIGAEPQSWPDELVGVALADADAVAREEARAAKAEADSHSRRAPSAATLDEAASTPALGRSSTSSASLRRHARQHRRRGRRRGRSAATPRRPRRETFQSLPYAATTPTHRAAPVRLAPLAPFPTADHSHRGYS